MGKTLFTLELPCPRERKAQAPPARGHKDKKLYTRKLKHKKSPIQGIFLCCRRELREVASYLFLFLLFSSI